MIKKNVYLPILIFVLFAGLYFLLAAYNHNDLLFKPVWDIRHYQSIAEQGYQARPCDPTTDYPMGKICGNVGGFPGWPIVVRTNQSRFKKLYVYFCSCWVRSFL